MNASRWPELSLDDKNAIISGDIFIDILQKVRQFKAANKKSLKSLVSLDLEKEKLSRIQPAIEDFKAVVNAKGIKEGGFSITLLE